ncbi:MAG: hypothetical protein PVI19_12795 [Syntrophobacterales bacterium]|jgi:hypothetical protein
MSSWLETYKPTASSRFQISLLATIWTIVGMSLTAVGGYWLLTSGDNKVMILILLVVAAGVGLGKSLLILNRAAHKFISRIKHRGEDKCVGGFLSVKGWALVAGMMLLGRLLRSLPISSSFLGAIYAAVGIGMLFSGRVIWRAVQNNRLEEVASGEN